ncbi:Wall-associated receptor kinase-like 8 [Sesamum alatum]|uniref:Wall-associated receptor kinase-like 8 n=1 Tax=Sesamum alatum TaxID=300844 RepID=A0AAE1YLK4_9LAMI|nr:Wall-associated receptor kinase-like 8 [Sesamum alatum]
MLMKILLYSFLIHLAWLQLPLAASDKTNTTRPPATITRGAKITKPGCQSKCGNLTVPYPFGIGLGSGCSIDPMFDINCDTSYNPPKAFSMGNLEVIDISDSQMRVKNSVVSRCYNQHGDLTFAAVNRIYLDPYFSFSDVNKVFSIGCGDLSMMTGTRGRNFTMGCVSACTKDDIIDGDCNGIGCCQTSIPKGLQGFNISVFRILDFSSLWPFNPCGYAFLGELDSLTFHSSDLSDPTFVNRTAYNVPIVLDWVIGNQNCTELLKSNGSVCHQNSRCIDSDTDIGGYRCLCVDGYEGNPYLEPGCTDIKNARIVHVIHKAYVLILLVVINVRAQMDSLAMV